MTDTAGPFDGSPWAEAQWARHAAIWAPSGVYGTPAASTTTGDLPLSVSGLSVGLGAGRAWVRGFGFERTGAAVMQSVSANTHSSFSRRDRIVLRRDLATHTIAPVLLTGTPSGSPGAPALTGVDAGSWDLPLFSFLVPPNSGTGINGIVDERVWVDAHGSVGTSGRRLYWDGSQWVKCAGPPELLYENASSGASGAVGVGAGQVGVLSVLVPPSGIASDVGAVVVTLAIKSTGAGSVGIARLSVAGVTVAVQFNATSTNPVEVPLILPRVALPAVDFAVGVTLQVDAGVAAQLDHSSIRVSC